MKCKILALSEKKRKNTKTVYAINRFFLFYNEQKFTLT